MRFSHSFYAIFVVEVGLRGAVNRSILPSIGLFKLKNLIGIFSLVCWNFKFKFLFLPLITLQHWVMLNTESFNVHLQHKLNPKLDYCPFEPTGDWLLIYQLINVTVYHITSLKYGKYKLSICIARSLVSFVTFAILISHKQNTAIKPLGIVYARHLLNVQTIAIFVLVKRIIFFFNTNTNLKQLKWDCLHQITFFSPFLI